MKTYTVHSSRKVVELHAKIRYHICAQIEVSEGMMRSNSSPVSPSKKAELINENRSEMGEIFRRSHYNGGMGFYSRVSTFPPPQRLFNKIILLNRSAVSISRGTLFAKEMKLAKCFKLQMRLLIASV
jgi:hypothetical protein